MLKTSLFSTGYRGIAAALLTLITAHVSYADGPGGKKPKDISKYERVVAGTGSIVVDKQLLDIYVRMMRYQTAGRDMRRLMDGSSAKPEDYLIIAIRNMRIGEKGELSKYLKGIYGQRSREVLQIQASFLRVNRAVFPMKLSGSGPRT